MKAKRSRPSIILSLLLCAILLISGSLLALHPTHAHCRTCCMICPRIGEFVQTLLGAAAVLTCIVPTGCILAGMCYGPPENRFVPEWTLVQRKVKLLN